MATVSGLTDELVLTIVVVAAATAAATCITCCCDLNRHPKKWIGIVRMYLVISSKNQLRSCCQSDIQ